MRDYVWSDFNRRLCSDLEQFWDDVKNGKSPRLAIFAPPRHGKSFVVSERFPAWVLGNDPSRKIVDASYGADIAEMCTRAANQLIKSDFYAKVFGTLPLVVDRSHDFETAQKGGYYGVGVGGGLTGRGADILIIDDPIKSWQDALSKAKRDAIWMWYATVAYTRLLPSAGVLLMHTRWHKDDLAGRILEKGGWKVLTFPAIDDAGNALDPVRYPIDSLRDIEATIGSTAWRALYQQQPSDTDGAIIKRGDIQEFDTPPPKSGTWCISVDATFKATDTSDFVSIQTWQEREKSYYCHDNDTRRMGFGDTLTAIDAMMRRYEDVRPTLVIEDKANGSAIIDTLRKKYSRIVPVDPQGGKVARAMAIQPIAEGHRIYIAHKAAWADSMLGEIADFPTGKHDDQVDAMTQAITYLDSKPTAAATYRNPLRG